MKFKKEWVIDFILNSNRLEGTVLKVEDLTQQLVNLDRVILPCARNHYLCLQFILKHYKEIPTHDTIMQLHAQLLECMDRFAGVYRTSSILGICHAPPPAQKVRYLIEQWLHLWNKKPFKRWTHKKTALHRHYEFQWISPFYDGNSRLARLLMVWDCLHHRTKMDPLKSAGMDRLIYYKEVQNYYDVGRKNLLGKQWV